MPDQDKFNESLNNDKKPTEKNPKKKVKQTTGKEAVGKSKLIIGLILIIAAVLMAFFVVPYFSNRQSVYYGLAAKRELTAGEQVTKDNYSELFEQVQTTDPNIAKNWFLPNNTPELYGKFVQRTIKKGTYISADDFDYKFNIVKINVPEDKELVGVRVPSIEADVGYLPKTGDIIRFYGLENDPDSVIVDENGKIRQGYGKKAFIYDLLQYVQIYRAVDSDGVNAGSGKQPVSMILLCSTAQVKQLIEAQNNGLIYFSLISTDNPTRAEECLALQEQIEVEYLSRNASIDNLEYSNMSVGLSKISVTNTDVSAGDYVSFAVTNEVEETYIDAKGEKKTIKITELFTPDILSCVKVTDVYDENGISKRLSYTGKPAFDIKKASLGLELTDEQVEALAQYMKNGTVIMQAITLDPENTEDTISIRMAVVSEAIRVTRIENLRAEQEAAAEAAAQAAETAAEDTTSVAAESEGDSK